MKRVLVFFVALLISLTASAIDTGAAFEDPEMQARYENLISEVRCLVCQNQTIKDSNVFLAADLRREIRRMMTEGMTDAEIADFLVARYGDFVLYNPRKSGRTLILWITPAMLLGIGAFVIVRVVRDRMKMPIDDDALKS
ncbi:MAG: cytochrome c-type biogenesis protein CcmH [Proteobacteria bacterium]|nr:cytochrome c-type biogenesis protein CcmH [Pseudomonadota bacterium]TDJ32202.1 MAG: cytochrome c-type biogenesis protein CcmH [Gammaproteobacteria bacterium]